MTHASLMQRAGAAVLTAGMLACAAQALNAQSASAGATWQRWTLADQTGDSSGAKSAQQLAVPIDANFALGRRWKLDVNGAYTSGTVTLRRGNADVTRDLSGPTDIRARMTGSFMNDALSVALGINAPTGRTSLKSDELEALRVLAAPASGMPVPVLGTGFGATLGLIAARTVGGWAVAGGATYEQRGDYAATDQLSAGISTSTRVQPGPAVHVSLGATGTVGNGDMSLYGVVDLFGTDALEVSATPAPTAVEYRLGPMLSFNWGYRPGLKRLPDLQFMAGVRVRSAYEDGVVGKVAGSSGTMANVAAAATLWRRNGWRVRGSIDAKTYSGLDVDSTLVTAGFSDLSVTALLAAPVGRTSIEPFIRAGKGSVDLGPRKSGSTTIAIGGRVVVR